MAVEPYHKRADNKKIQVESMFNKIADSYDFLNHFLSFGTDRYWRKKTVAFLKERKDASILDVATGTADLAIRAHKTLNPRKITGIDISEEMLEIGRQKVEKNKLERIELLYGDSEDMKFSDNAFDAVMTAFGIRNFENPEKGLTEIYRVLKPGGKFVILEFSRPQKFPVRLLYDIYFRKIVPAIGRIISKDTVAYSYLPESVFNFPEGHDFLNCLSAKGFVNLSLKSLTFGIATIYTAVKPMTFS